MYGMVWEQREGWWFGPGDCKSLWPALTSSGWQRCLSPRHSSTCPSRPPYWSHIGRSRFQTPHPSPPHTPPENFSTLTLAFALMLLKVSFFSLLSRKRTRKMNVLWLYFLFFVFFSGTFSFYFTYTSYCFLLLSFPVPFQFLSFPFSVMPHSFSFSVPFISF